MKNENSTDEEKEFDESEHPFMMRAFHRFSVEGTYLNMMNGYITNQQSFEHHIYPQI